MTRYQLKLVRLALSSLENEATECAKAQLKAALKSHEDKTDYDEDEQDREEREDDEDEEDEYVGLTQDERLARMKAQLEELKTSLRASGIDLDELLRQVTA